MNRFTITVTAVNDAPVLNDTALNISIAEDAAVPTGAVGTLISSFTGGITMPIQVQEKVSQLLRSTKQMVPGTTQSITEQPGI